MDDQLGFFLFLAFVSVSAGLLSWSFIKNAKRPCPFCRELMWKHASVCSKCCRESEAQEIDTPRYNGKTTTKEKVVIALSSIFIVFMLIKIFRIQ